MAYNLDEALPVQPSDLKTVVLVVEKLRKLSLDIVNIEEQLYNKKAELKQVSEIDLPDLMDSVKLKELTLEDGEKLTINKFVNASIPTAAKIADADEDDQPELEKRLRDGVLWLRENGGISLLKNKLEIEFSKGQDNIVGDLIGRCEELGLPHKRNESVHSKTLSNWLKEQLDAGVKVPADTFALFVGRKAVLKKPKEGKTQKGVKDNG